MDEGQDFYNFLKQDHNNFLSALFSFTEAWTQYTKDQDSLAVHQDFESRDASRSYIDNAVVPIYKEFAYALANFRSLGASWAARALFELSLAARWAKEEPEFGNKLIENSHTNEERITASIRETLATKDIRFDESWLNILATETHLPALNRILTSTNRRLSLEAIARNLGLSESYNKIYRALSPDTHASLATHLSTRTIRSGPLGETILDTQNPLTMVLPLYYGLESLERLVRSQTVDVYTDANPLMDAFINLKSLADDYLQATHDFVDPTMLLLPDLLYVRVTFPPAWIEDSNFYAPSQHTDIDYKYYYCSELTGKAYAAQAFRPPDDTLDRYIRRAVELSDKSDFSLVFPASEVIDTIDLEKTYRNEFSLGELPGKVGNFKDANITTINTGLSLAYGKSPSNSPRSSM